MRFDDRLTTVLKQLAPDAHGRAVQWRQLVELVARGGGISPTLREQALQRIAVLMTGVEDDLLSATARAIAGPSVPVELIALFAARGAPQCAALLAGVELSPAEWSAVKAVAAGDVVPLLAALEPAPDVPASSEAMGEEEPVAGVATPVSAEPQVVEETHADDRPQVVAKRAPLPGGLFRWESGPTGEIDWVEGAPRAALVGRSLAETFADPFSARLPFADEPLVLAENGALAGEWRWSGTPAFFADTGRFAGYRGIARREGAYETTSAELAAEHHAAEDDGLRELMHELRTPLNAIIGFGEIIEGQYLGPAHRGYRERAAEIVRQARNLSDAIDNLDLAARLRSGRLKGTLTTGLEPVMTALERCKDEGTDRGLRVSVESRAGAGTLAMPPELAERLVRQFALAMLEPAVAGEPLRLAVERHGRSLAIGIDRATALRGLSEQQLVADRGRAGMRFALRLVQGLAAMTGGRLDIGADRLVLILPMTD